MGRCQSRNARGDWCKKEDDHKDNHVGEHSSWVNVHTDAGDDPVNHPSHYTHGGIEVLDAIEAWCLPYHLGNVVKYVARCGHKGKMIEDLKKARFYLDRHIANLEKR